MSSYTPAVNSVIYPVLRALMHNGPMYIVELADVLDEDEKAIRGAVSSLKFKGLVKVGTRQGSNGRKLYMINRPGEEQIRPTGAALVTEWRGIGQTPDRRVGLTAQPERVQPQ